MMPFAAILRHDLYLLMGTWLVRLWLAGTVVLTLVLVMGNWPQMRTAPLIALLLVPYLVFPWFLVVMVLGISPVSGARSEALSDGILSRPVTRYEYLFATWLARVLLVLGAYLIVIVPTIWLVARWDRPVEADPVTLFGVCAALGVVGLVLTLQVTLAFLLGTLLRNPLLAIVMLLVIWYPVDTILHAFQVEEFSPITLSQALPTLLRRPWRGAEEQTPDGTTQEDLQELQRQFDRLMLGGRAPAKPQPGFFDQGDYKDFSLVRVILGYGIPTLLALGLTTLSFCWRDL